MSSEPVELLRSTWEDRARELVRVLTPLLNQHAPQTLTCHWNGSVALLSDAEGERNKAIYRVADKTILISSRYLADASLWRTLLHELLHAHSVHGTGGSFREYAATPGWEEAPVEYLQRALRKSVLRDAGFVVSEDAFLQGNSDWEEIYGTALNGWIRPHAGFYPLGGFVENPLAFACAVLARPIRDRASYLMERFMPPTTSERKAAMIAFSAARRAIENPHGAIVDPIPSVL